MGGLRQIVNASGRQPLRGRAAAKYRGRDEDRHRRAKAEDFGALPESAWAATTLDTAPRAHALTGLGTGLARYLQPLREFSDARTVDIIAAQRGHDNLHEELRTRHPEGGWATRHPTGGPAPP